MTIPPADQESQPNLPPQAASPAKEKNVLGITAFIVAIVGFVFACIPGALIVGWILLPIAFILAIVALFLKGKSKTLALIGLIISVLGTIVGAVVFTAVVANAFDDAFSGGDTTVAAPEGQTEETEESEKADDEQGTRANPYPIGSAITQGDWTVTINSVNLDATDELLEDNMFNDAPDAGSVYILVNMTATYNGTDPDGDSVWATVNYITADGNTIDGLAKFISAPEPFESLSTLYEGASITGNQALQVPADTAADGVLAVNPTMMGDKVFVAVK
ncbi:hypothetical protein FB472_0657 [Rhodoglobus vestalii]|uniref:DUF4352 domain-containing protein n=1 Tax=Rhodoglobus vestalii TaxID=193384 RepID=A0A8H2PXA2_9MICO|nr:hypothetical protein [Rhodoglobus vestalii]TQO19119.1 hypothetical protein FB472_0657 [Rhodoglobus vestalii]